MRKIIIQWDSIPGALSYQVCHNCRLGETGMLEEMSGELHDVQVGVERAGRPVFVKSNAARGRNTFHVRASIEQGSWGRWSEPRSFDVHEPGNAHHQPSDEL